MAGGILWLGFRPPSGRIHPRCLVMGVPRQSGQCGPMGSWSHGQKMNSCKLLKTLGTGDDGPPRDPAT